MLGKELGLCLLNTWVLRKGEDVGRLTLKVPKASPLTVEKRGGKKGPMGGIGLLVHITVLQTYDRKVIPLKLALITVREKVRMKIRGDVDL